MGRAHITEARRLVNGMARGSVCEGGRRRNEERGVTLSSNKHYEPYFQGSRARVKRPPEQEAAKITVATLAAETESGIFEASSEQQFFPDRQYQREVIHLSSSSKTASNPKLPLPNEHAPHDHISTLRVSVSQGV
jgi:hypothetical protein